MNESARSMPSKRSRTDGATGRRRRRRRPRGARDPAPSQTSATPARSSTVPAFVAPALATTANTPSLPSSIERARERRAGEPAPVVARARGTTSTSITRAAVDDGGVHACRHAPMRQRAGRSPPRRRRAACRAATSADRFPAEPPDTNTPPASAGKPARSATHRRAWFSAQMAPAPSIQPAAIVEEAPTTRSNSTDAFVGAPGTNASEAGGRWRSWPARAPRPRSAAPRRRPALRAVIVRAGAAVELLRRTRCGPAAAGSRCGSARRRRWRATAPRSPPCNGASPPECAAISAELLAELAERVHVPSGRRPRCAGPRPSTAPRRRAS